MTYNKNGVPFLGDSRGKRPQDELERIKQAALDKHSDEIMTEQATQMHRYRIINNQPRRSTN